MPDLNLNQNRLYDDLAWIWPFTSPPEDYEEEAGEIIDLIRQHAQRDVKTLLDLGCGGGHLDSWLKQAFKITGVDLSANMLDLARELNPEATYIQGDMRNIRLPECFDAVMIADAIDYMLTEEDLKAVFATAYKHLKPGGVLCTYAEETNERFQQNKTQSFTHNTGDIEITAVENFYDPDRSDTTYECTFVYFIRRKGILSIEWDHHILGIFHVATWIKLLEEVGFEVHVTEYEVAGPMFLGVKTE